VSGINVTIGANPAPLKKGLAEAETALKSFDDSSRFALSGIAKFAAGAVAAGAAIGAGLVAKAFDAIGAQSKLAQQLGATVGQMAALQRAGDLAGVSSEALTTGLRKLNNTIGEAQAGNKAAADSLARLGLTADQLSTMSVDERMNAVAIAISGMADQTQRAAAAQDLFGKTGQVMLPLLQDSGEQLRIAAEQTQAWGLALSDVDAAKVEAANDAMSSISLVMDGFINRIAVKFAPLVEAIGKAFENTANETGGFQGVAERVFSFVIKTAGFVADAIRGIQTVLKGMEVIWHGITVAVTTAANVLAHFIDLIPGVDMSGPIAQINRLTASAKGNFAESRAEFHKLMTEPMPSVALDKFVADVEKASAEAATKAVEARNNAAATAVESAAPAVATAAAAAPAVETAKEDAAAAALAREQAAADARRAMLADEIATEVAMEWEKQSLLTQATKAGQEQRLAFEKMTGDARVKHVAGALAEMTASTANSNRKMFELNKAAGITNAIINTYEGVTKALASYPPPLSFAMAGAQLAAGMAQVSAIKNQQFGGKGGGGAAPAPSSIAGGGGGASPAAVGGGAAREVVVSGVNPNDLFSGAQLVELINRAQRDGAVVMRFA
jgi:hypothetical protein